MNTWGAITKGLAIVAISAGLAAGAPPANYDEAKVGDDPLPDPLVLDDGMRVTDVESWVKRRRPELLQLFRAQVYGRSPKPEKPIALELLSMDREALGGLAMRKQVRIYPTGDREGPRMDLLLYIPNAAKKPVPAFLGLNFGGNQTVSKDPGIAITTSWVRDDKEHGVVDHKATEATRGAQESRWQIEKVLNRGYATGTIYYGDIEPDHPEGWKASLRGALAEGGAGAAIRPDDWGAVAAWAWGLSRALDYLESDDDIDSRRVIVHGHSRLGKAALWAGAQDQRFAMVISNNSGCGGAALSKRNFGETVERINTAFPHWFCGNFRHYNGHEADLPVDQHELIALIAPRPVYVASATEDLWADPKGEFLAAVNAERVYRLFGKVGLGTDEMPAPDRPIGEAIGYHLRTGEHDITAYDWDRYLDFADKRLAKKGSSAGGE